MTACTPETAAKKLCDGACGNVSGQASAGAKQAGLDGRAGGRDFARVAVAEEEPSGSVVQNKMAIAGLGIEEVLLLFPWHPHFGDNLFPVALQVKPTGDNVSLRAFGRQHLFQFADDIGIALRQR